MRGFGRLVAAVGLLAGFGGCDDDAAQRSVAESIAPQLAYLDRESSLVVAVDLRYDGDNWEDLEPLVSRGLREARSQQEGDASRVPLNLEGGLQQLAQFAGLDFDDDVRPVLDGHLVVGVSLAPRQPLPDDLAEIEDLLDGAVFDPSRNAYVRPDVAGTTTGPIVRKRDGSPLTQEDVARLAQAQSGRATDPSVVLVYRTREGDLGKVVDELVAGDRLEAVPGHPDARAIDDQVALVGDDTVVSVSGGETTVKDALDGAESGGGFPAGRFEAGERDVDLDDPLVLAVGDLTLARQFVEEPNLQRAIAEVPYLSAIERISAGLDFGDDEALGRVRISTGGTSLDAGDLPLGPAGELSLPETDGIAGASRDQSRTTTFAAKVARALFEDSRFVAAVERTERDLGVGFEDEVLRQFDCPSVSQFQDTAEGEPRFGARSCVGDPERMRALLPRLAPHLPRILSAMQGLEEEGLLGLLLVAPDAPLTPSTFTQLAQIVVEPLGGGDDARPEEDLYEVRGLADPTNPLAVPGVSQVVFGMIGDVFVVGSDREMARSAATVATEELDGEAASALRIPVERALAGQIGADEAAVLGAVFSELEVTFSATTDATIARARLRYQD